MNYLAWRDRADGKRCHLTGLLNSPDVYAYLCEGVSLKEKWTEDAAYKMDQDYKTRIQLTDSLINQDDVIIASERLKAFLEENGAAEGNEFLPVSIINHKLRKAKERYFLVNHVDNPDAFDQVNSVYTKNAIDTTQIDTVKKLVVDFAKIRPTAQLFRLKYYKTMILVRQDLADKLTASGMTGFSFMTLDKYIEFKNS